ncbi:TPR-like protein [Athelia psychrophila]|uniref:TPR-like protein n=1 Tax=Athelia psychrophila TaxID=1759441 RepID=A0A166MCU7_9AGAM|nr:TPR-like protein [Fibularhizoctonia sp. CBS 109695]
MHKNAEAGPSSAPMPVPPFLTTPATETLHKGISVEVDISASRPASSIPDLSYNTSHTSGGTVNNVNGNMVNQVNNHYYAVPPTAPINRMHSLAPFNDAPVDRISSFFMGREGDMTAIASAVNSCDGDAPYRYAVWGMPGLGKSQLALSYANASFKAGHHTHVIWIPATTLEKVNQGLVKVLDLFQHSDRHNIYDQAARLTAARLCLEQSDQRLKWLIILDDVTLVTLHFLREHLPRQNGHGSILITTRTLDVANAVTSVAGQQHPVHELKTLSTEQSAELLFKSAGIDSSATADLEKAQQLVKQIGCLPLAVEQAGSYMRRSGLTGAGQLESLYDQGGLEEIIGWDNSLSTYEEKSILVTVTVQLQRLGEIDPHLLKLLQLLSFFDPESIPLDIVVLGAGRVGRRLRSSKVLKANISLIPKPVRSRIGQVSTRRYRPSTNVLADVSVKLRPVLELVCSEKWLRGALHHLEDLSLAQPRYDEKTSLHIHDLIQLVLQQSATADQLGEDLHCALAVALLCGAFETIKDIESPHSWTECERFVPHLMALSKHAGKPTPELLYMSGKVAWYFFRRGRYDEAEALYQRALVGQKEQLGADHPSTLITVIGIAVLYEHLGRFTEAETLFQQALAVNEQQLGADHPATLGTVGNLANLYKKQGKYAEAEILYQRALAGYERLGANHPGTLRTVGNLGCLYVQWGKYEKAEDFCERALAGRQRQLGADHPETMGTLSSLGWLYMQWGKYEEAEDLSQRALAGQQRQLGADHPNTLETINNLAKIRVQQDRIEEAETLFNRALTGRIKAIGIRHPDTLESIDALARLYDKQGRLEEAQMVRVKAGEERS